VARTLRQESKGLPLRGFSVEVVKGPDQGRSFVAKSETITIGSAEGNDLVLSDETVSRYHLELQSRGDRIFAIDHGSTNGTSFAGALIERAAIPAGSVLALGRSKVRVDEAASLNLEVHDRDRLGGLLGRSSEMRSLMAKIARAGQSDISVLLLGETGTGKELIAHAIHGASKRRSGPFETVDCGSLLPTLIASELFGHEKGAFTGADQQHIGAFERAHGGTLFLDEVGELPPALQTALLGALERRSFRRLGGQKPISVDVRVVSATNRDLRSEVNAGSFRQDLYFRIGVVLLRIPPLRERAGDVPLLIDHFLGEAGFDGDRSEIIPDEVLESLEKHHWPGNVRELRNFTEAALAMGEPPVLEGQGAPKKPQGEARSDPSLVPYSEARAEVLKSFELEYLKALMERTRWNVSLAAREAKMNRQHLINMLKRNGVK
jgi:DNA-binding NtrC family response regulator